MANNPGYPTGGYKLPENCKQYHGISDEGFNAYIKINLYYTNDKGELVDKRESVETMAKKYMNYCFKKFYGDRWLSSSGAQGEFYKTAMKDPKAFVSRWNEDYDLARDRRKTKDLYNRAKANGIQYPYGAYEDDFQKFSEEQRAQYGEGYQESELEVFFANKFLMDQGWSKDQIKKLSKADRVSRVRTAYMVGKKIDDKNARAQMQANQQAKQQPSPAVQQAQQQTDVNTGAVPNANAQEQTPININNMSTQGFQGIPYVDNSDPLESFFNYGIYQPREVTNANAQEWENPYIVRNQNEATYDFSGELGTITPDPNYDATANFLRKSSIKEGVKWIQKGLDIELSGNPSGNVNWNNYKPKSKEEQSAIVDKYNQYLLQLFNHQYKNNIYNIPSKYADRDDLTDEEKETLRYLKNIRATELYNLIDKIEIAVRDNENRRPEQLLGDRATAVVAGQQPRQYNTLKRKEHLDNAAKIIEEQLRPKLSEEDQAALDSYKETMDKFNEGKAARKKAARAKFEQDYWTELYKKNHPNDPNPKWETVNQWKAQVVARDARHGNGGLRYDINRKFDEYFEESEANRFEKQNPLPDVLNPYKELTFEEFKLNIGDISNEYSDVYGLVPKPWAPKITNDQFKEMFDLVKDDLHNGLIGIAQRKLTKWFNEFLDPYQPREERKAAGKAARKAARKETFYQTIGQIPAAVRAFEDMANPTFYEQSLHLSPVDMFLYKYLHDPIMQDAHLEAVALMEEAPIVYGNSLAAELARTQYTVGAMQVSSLFIGVDVLLSMGASSIVSGMARRGVQRELIKVASKNAMDNMSEKILLKIAKKEGAEGLIKRGISEANASRIISIGQKAGRKAGEKTLRVGTELSMFQSSLAEAIADAYEVYDDIMREANTAIQKEKNKMQALIAESDNPEMFAYDDREYQKIYESLMQNYEQLAQQFISSYQQYYNENGGKDLIPPDQLTNDMIYQAVAMQAAEMAKLKARTNYMISGLEDGIRRSYEAQAIKAQNKATLAETINLYMTERLGGAFTKLMPMQAMRKVLRISPEAQFDAATRTFKSSKLKSVKNLAGKTVKGGLKTGLIETGQEVAGQGVVRNIYKQVGLANADAYVQSQYDGYGVLSVSNDLYRAVRDGSQFMKQAWFDTDVEQTVKSTLLGTLISPGFNLNLGMNLLNRKNGSFARIGNENGVSYWTRMIMENLPLSIPAFADVNEALRQNATLKREIESINEYLATPEGKAFANKNSQLFNLQLEMMQAAAEGNQFKYDNTGLAMGIAEATYLSRFPKSSFSIGRMEQLKNAANIKSASQESQQISIQEFRSELGSAAENMTDEEILDTIESSGKKMLDIYKGVEKERSNIRERLGEEIDPDVESMLIFDKMMLSDFTARTQKDKATLNKAQQIFLENGQDVYAEYMSHDPLLISDKYTTDEGFQKAVDSLVADGLDVENAILNMNAINSSYQKVKSHYNKVFNDPDKYAERIQKQRNEAARKRLESINHVNRMNRRINRSNDSRIRDILLKEQTRRKIVGIGNFKKSDFSKVKGSKRSIVNRFLNTLNKANAAINALPRYISDINAINEIKRCIDAGLLKHDNIRDVLGYVVNNIDYNNISMSPKQVANALLGNKGLFEEVSNTVGAIDVLEMNEHYPDSNVSMDADEESDDFDKRPQPNSGEINSLVDQYNSFVDSITEDDSIPNDDKIDTIENSKLLNDIRTTLTNMGVNYIIDDEYHIEVVVNVKTVEEEDAPVFEDDIVENDDDIMLQLGKKKREEFLAGLEKKRQDLDEWRKKEAVRFFEELEDNKENNAFIRACIRWMLKNTCVIPRDAEKVRAIFNEARGKGIDVERFNSPLDLYLYLKGFDEMVEGYESDFNPDNAPGFSNKRVVQTVHGELTVYDVEDSKEAKHSITEAIYKAFNPGIRSKHSPWCISTFNVHKDGTFSETESSSKHWNHYSGHQRQIAFKGNIPVAMNAGISTTNAEWWDLNDRSPRATLDEINMVDDFYDNENTYEEVTFNGILYAISENHVISKCKTIYGTNEDGSKYPIIIITRYSNDGQQCGIFIQSIDVNGVDIDINIDDKGCGIRVGRLNANAFLRLVGDTIRIETDSSNYEIHVPNYQNGTEYLQTYLDLVDKLAKTTDNLQSIEYNDLRSQLKELVDFANVVIKQHVKSNHIDVNEDFKKLLNLTDSDIAPAPTTKETPYPRGVNNEGEQVIDRLRNYVQNPEGNNYNSVIDETQPLAPQAAAIAEYINENGNVLPTEPAEQPYNPSMDMEHASEPLERLESTSKKKVERKSIADLINRMRGADLAAEYMKQFDSNPDLALNDKLIEILRWYNFEVFTPEDFHQVFGDDALGAFDWLNKVIYLAESGEWNGVTVPEEFAHAFVKMMGTRYRKKEWRNKYPETRLFSELMDEIESTDIYKQVYENYKDVYVNENGKPNVAKIKEEAIGQALAAALVAENRKRDSFLNRLFDAFAKLIQKIASFFSDKVKFDNTIRGIANDILNYNFGKELDKIDDSGYRATSYTATLQSVTERDGGRALDFLTTFSNMGAIISGSLSLRAQGLIRRPNRDDLHDIDMIIPESVVSFNRHHPAFQGLKYRNTNVQRLTTEEYANMLLDFDFFRNLVDRYPNIDFVSVYPTRAADGQMQLVASMAWSEDPDLVSRFKSLEGPYAERLKQFTEEERNQLYLFDFFIQNRSTDDYMIHRDDDNGINLAHFNESMEAKMKLLGRAKDIYDYQKFLPFERSYKTSGDKLQYQMNYGNQFTQEQIDLRNRFSNIDNLRNWIKSNINGDGRYGHPQASVNATARRTNWGAFKSKLATVGIDVTGDKSDRMGRINIDKVKISTNRKFNSDVFYQVKPAQRQGVAEQFKGKVIWADYGTGKSTATERFNNVIDGDYLHALLAMELYNVNLPVETAGAMIKSVVTAKGDWNEYAEAYKAKAQALADQGNTVIGGFRPLKDIASYYVVHNSYESARTSVANRDVNPFNYTKDSYKERTSGIANKPANSVIRLGAGQHISDVLKQPSNGISESNRTYKEQYYIDNNITPAITENNKGFTYNGFERHTDPRYSTVRPILDDCGAFDYVRKGYVHSEKKNANGDVLEPASEVTFMITTEKHPTDGEDMKIIWIVDANESDDANNGLYADKFGDHQLINILDTTDITDGSPRKELIHDIFNEYDNVDDKDGFVYSKSFKISKVGRGSQPIIKDNLGVDENGNTHYQSQSAYDRTELSKLLESKDGRFGFDFHTPKNTNFVLAQLVQTKDGITKQTCPQDVKIVAQKKTSANEMILICPSPSGFKAYYPIYVVKRSMDFFEDIMNNAIDNGEFGKNLIQRIQTFLSSIVTGQKSTSNFSDLVSMERGVSESIKKVGSRFEFGYRGGRMELSTPLVIADKIATLSGRKYRIQVGDNIKNNVFDDNNGQGYTNDEVLKIYLKEMVSNPNVKMTPRVNIDKIRQNHSLLDILIESKLLYAPSVIPGRLGDENVGFESQLGQPNQQPQVKPQPTISPVIPMSSVVSETSDTAIEPVVNPSDNQEQSGKKKKRFGKKISSDQVVKSMNESKTKSDDVQYQVVPKSTKSFVEQLQELNKFCHE